ncbi:alpha/beta-Hydrolases superfamily protein [Actinidia rufa]|uniref:Alpha/beta-Hydrolases superfamily protein n=1 Tax=Actinidia rufa TaxID=165716 RepID=A0A7J0DDT4_9ERIC|nr:alpha/beta-Hydrolases superfamily protein [Actinidia rufa]
MLRLCNRYRRCISFSLRRSLSSSSSSSHNSLDYPKEAIKNPQQVLPRCLRLLPSSTTIRPAFPSLSLLPHRPLRNPLAAVAASYALLTTNTETEPGGRRRLRLVDVNRRVGSGVKPRGSVGFEFRVAAFLADIAAANASRRSAIVGAGGGAVLDWLLETVAVFGDNNGTQAEAARALAYLIADPNVAEAVLGRPHAVPYLLRFIFSSQPQRSKKMFIGDGAKLVRDAFQLAKEKSSCIILIDEIDAIGTKRFDSEVSGDREVQRTMLELLNQVDGFSSDDRIKILFSCVLADWIVKLSIHIPLKKLDLESYRSMLVAALMDIATSNCDSLDKVLLKPSLPRNAEMRDIAAAIEVIEEGGMHLDEPHGSEEDDDGGTGMKGIGIKILGGTTVLRLSRTNGLPELEFPSANFDSAKNSPRNLLFNKISDSSLTQQNVTSVVVPGLWDDLLCQHVAVPFAAWALANWAMASNENRSHSQELDQDGHAVMTALITAERSVKWHGSLVARFLLEDHSLPLNDSQCFETWTGGRIEKMIRSQVTGSIVESTVIDT